MDPGLYIEPRESSKSGWSLRHCRIAVGESGIPGQFRSVPYLLNDIGFIVDERHDEAWKLAGIIGSITIDENDDLFICWATCLQDIV